MNQEALRIRTKRFAVSIIKLSQGFKNTPEINIPRNQLLRAGTSVGANYRAACRARSQREFFSKLSIVIEEADECLYWMEILAEAELVSKNLMEKEYNERTS
ncbi:MAG: four helix bundle protein [Cytophagaceae bacterium]|nr:four helix bundle protein [Cytophagaceae bacterium]